MTQNTFMHSSKNEYKKPRLHNPDTILNEYLTGSTPTEIAYGYQIGRATVYRYFKACGGLTIAHKVAHWEARRRANEK